MIGVLSGFPIFAAPRAKDTARAGPEARRRAPVFIHDAVTPFNATTVLGDILRHDLDAMPSPLNSGGDSDASDPA